MNFGDLSSAVENIKTMVRIRFNSLFCIEYF